MKYALIISLALICSCQQKEAYKATGFEGKAMPAVDLLLADSATHINLATVTSEKPIMIFYFGADCPYSHAQMKRITAAKEKLKGYTIYAATTSTMAEMKHFSERFHLTAFQNIIIARDFDDIIGTYYKLEGVPFTAVFDKNRRLQKAYVGTFNIEQL